LKRLEIPDAPLIIMALQDEIRRNRDARYDHRLHSVLLVAKGHTCEEVADLLGDSTRTVQSWVNAFLKDGLYGLCDKDKSGRPKKLSEADMRSLREALRNSPDTYGLPGHLWEGKNLSQYILEEFGVEMGVRQCQRLFHELGFSYRKPRPMVFGTTLEEKEALKKTTPDEE
jgi:transposase